MRWIVFIFVLLLLVGAGLWTGNNYIRKDDYAIVRNAIEQRLSMMMGKEFRIHGNVNMTTSLSPTIQFNDLRLANSDWARNDYLMTINKFEFQLGLVPLLFGKYTVSNARFSDVAVNLEIRDDGVSNWQFSSGESVDTAELEVVIQTLETDKLEFQFLDQRDDREYLVSLDKFVATTDDFGEPIHIDAEGTVNNSQARLSGLVGSYDQFLSGTESTLELRGTYKDVNITIDGNINGAESTGFLLGDVHLTATGKDIMSLTDIYEFELFTTDNFSIDGHLQGTLKEISAQKVVVEMESGGNTLYIAGATDDLLGLSQFDIQVHVTGNDLNSQYGELTGLDLPDTDSYDIQARLIRSNGVTVMTELAADATDDSTRITASGSIGNIEQLQGFDLLYQIAGDNIEVIEDFFGLDLPVTDKFLLGGHLMGSLQALEGDDLNFEVVRQELSVSANGNVQNLNEGIGINLAVKAEGNDLGDIDTLLRPFTDLSLRDTILQNPELDEAVTGQFVIEGIVSGIAESLKLSSARGSAIRDGNQITLQGSIDDLFGMENIDMQFTAEGPDIANLNVVLPTELPQTGRYKTSGRITGTGADVAITDFLGELTRSGHTLEFSGDLGNLQTFKGQDLDIKISGSNIRDLEAFVELRFPPTQQYSASAQLVESNGRLNLQRIIFDGQYDSIAANIRGSIANITQQPEFNISMELVGEEFGDGGVYWDMEFPPEGPFSFGGTIEGTGNRISLKEFHGKVGESDFIAYATLVTGERLKIVDAHISGRFDATPWLPETDEPPEIRQRLISDREIDLSILQDFDLDLLVDQLLVTDKSAMITIENGSIQLKDGVLHADPFDAQYQQAIIDLNLSIDVTGRNPKFNMGLVSRGFDLGMFLDQTYLVEHTQGIVDINFKIVGSGNSLAQVASSANGEVYILFTNGFFPKQNLPLRITDFFRASFSWLRRQNDHEIECVMSYAKIENGIYEQDFLFLKSNQMVMGGTGSIALENEQLEFVLAPRPNRRGFLSSDLDVNIRGTILNPTYSLNRASAARSGAKYYGAYLVLGPVGFLIPRSGRRLNVECVDNIDDFKTNIEAVGEVQ